MLWQYTVTPRFYKWILRTEERGFSPKPSVGKRIFNAIVILYFLFLILVFSSYLLSSFRDGAFSLPFILENLAILLFLSAALYCFATKRNPPRFSKSEHILGLCCVCVKNGWFYFMRTFTNGEYYFRFFLPREAFSAVLQRKASLLYGSIFLSIWTEILCRPILSFSASSASAPPQDGRRAFS